MATKFSFKTLVTFLLQIVRTQCGYSIYSWTKVSRVCSVGAEEISIISRRIQLKSFNVADWSPMFLFG